MNRRDRRRWLRAVRASGVEPGAVVTAKALARYVERDGVVRLRDERTGRVTQEVRLTWPR